MSAIIPKNQQKYRGTSILLWTTRRIKEHMDAVFLTVGGILIPFGFYLKIEQPQLDDVGTATVIVGLVAWLLAYYKVKSREKREKIERQTEAKLRQEEIQDNHKVLVNIYQELVKLNQGNEHGNTTKRS